MGMCFPELTIVTEGLQIQKELHCKCRSLEWVLGLQYMAVHHAQLCGVFLCVCITYDGMTTSYLLCVLTVSLAKESHSGFLSNLPVNIFPYLSTVDFSFFISYFMSLPEAVEECFIEMNLDISGSKDFRPHLTFLKLSKAPRLKRKVSNQV